MQLVRHIDLNGIPEIYVFLLLDWPARRNREAGRRGVNAAAIDLHQGRAIIGLLRFPLFSSCEDEG
jgi:hypothetical protein